MTNTEANNPYGVPNSDPQNFQSAEVSATVIELLRRTKGWVFFLAILGYIGCGLMVLAALVMMVGMGFISSKVESGLPIGFVGLGLIYLVMAAFYIYPCIKLHKYAKAIKSLVQTQSSSDLEDALEHQRGFWKFIGVIALVITCIYAAIFVVAIIGGIGAAVLAS